MRYPCHLLAVIAALLLFAHAQAVPPVLAQTVHVGPDSIYPDPTLTPGDVFPDVTADNVCGSGYASSVRNVPAVERQIVLVEYGFSGAPGTFELDHFVPLELGGSNAVANLWPEPYSPVPGSHEKDLVEDYLHLQVCTGKMDLADAQAAIESDWYAVYLMLPGVQAAMSPQTTPDGESGHTWYTSTAQSSTTYYCDDDPLWQTLNPRNLVTFATVADLLAAYPDKHLHQPCLDGATGP